MNLIVDASVAVKWLLDEGGSGAARALLDEDLSAPDLILLEVFSAVAKRVRRGEALVAQRNAALATVRSAIPNLVPGGRMTDAAEQLARTFGHPIYDCVYIALAQDLRRPLVTADERQFMLARKARIEARLL